MSIDLCALREMLTDRMLVVVVKKKKMYICFAKQVFYSVHSTRFFLYFLLSSSPTERWAFHYICTSQIMFLRRSIDVYIRCTITVKSTNPVFICIYQSLYEKKTRIHSISLHISMKKNIHIKFWPILDFCWAR